MSTWRYLADDDAGAAEGLALDEALMAAHSRGAESAPPTLRLYTYADHAALCGRFQHLEAEIDVAACRRTGTAFNRRPTGGGAIVMGAGQLGVAVTSRAPVGERPRTTLRRLAEGVVAGLAVLGIRAAFGGKNDLKVGGRKIAGLGLYLDGNGGMLFHASVLADLDIPFMLEVLDIPAAKLGDQAALAVAMRVTTVSRELDEAWTGSKLRDAIAAGFAGALGISLDNSAPSTDELARADSLVQNRYESAEWRFARSPQADATATTLLKTPEGLVRVYVALQGDTIKSVWFAGDYNVLPAPIVAFEDELKWTRPDRAAVASAAGTVFGEGTGLAIEPEALVDAVITAADRARRRDRIAAPVIDGSCYFPEQEVTT